MLGALDAWRAGLPDVGVEVGDVTVARPELVVAPPALVRAALRLEPASVIVEGRAQATLGRAGYDVRRFLPRPRIEEPSLLVPFEQPKVASYAVRRWSVVDRRWKSWRSGVAAALLERGRPLPFQPTLTVGARKGGPPYVIAAARDLGVPASVDWVLSLGQGDVLSRNVFHLFRKDATTPEWVLKFARVPRYAEPFDRDERGLRIAADAGATAAGRAPRLLGRFVVEGIQASLETAAVGHRLRELLQLPGGRAGRGRRLVDDVAAWIVELATETAAPPEALAEERRRLLDEVVPRWIPQGATVELVRHLPPLPAVAQHNDLGSWNVIVDENEFTAVDWESARRHGLPLWDLLYFLADALAVLDGAADGEHRAEHTRSLFRGQLPSSSVLFAWIRRAVDALAIPADAVGPITTLCWLHHSLSPVARAEARERVGDHTQARMHGTEHNAEMWLRDPALGAGWDGWRR